MSATFELWTAPKCASGSRVAVLHPVNAARATWQVDNANSLALSVQRDFPGRAQLIMNRVVRATTAAGDVSEWVVDEITEAKGDLFSQVTCLPLQVVLGRVLLRHTITGGRTYWNNGLTNCQAGNYLATFAIPSLEDAGIDWVSIGTIEPTIRFNLAWERWTVLELVNALAERTSCEFVFRRNGDTGYYIDLVEEQGSTADIILIRPDKNLLQFTRQRRSAPLRTVVVPTGAVPDGDDGEPAGIGYNAWRVSAISGLELTPEDPAGGGDPIAFDDQLNGLYVLKPDGTLTQITDTVASTQKITVASATGIAVGDHISIRADSDGTLLTELVNPAAITYFGGTPHGRIVGRPEDAAARGERNHLLNPLFATWTTKKGFYRAQANGIVNSTTITLKSLPAGLVILVNDVVGSQNFSPRYVTTGGTVAGDGTVSIIVNNSMNLADGAEVVVAAVSPPDSCSAYRAALAPRQIGVAAATLDGAFNGAATTNYVALDGLTVGAVVLPGDQLSYGASYANSAMVLVGGTVNGSGQINLVIDGAASAGDNDAARITRLTWPSDGGDYAPLLTQVPNGTRTSYLQTPSITVRYSDDLPLVWAHVRTNLIATQGGTLTEGGGVLPVKLALINAGTSAELASVVGEDRTIGTGEVVGETLRVAHALTASTSLALRIYPPHSSSGTPFGFRGVAAAVRWVMLTVGADPNVPFGDGSHANVLWHLGNRTLQDTSDGEPTTYTATVADLKAMGVNTDTLVLGGSAKVYDPELGVSTTLRMVGLAIDPFDPLNTVVTFSRLSPKITKKLASRAAKQFVQVNVTNNYTVDGNTIPLAETVTAVPTSSTPVDVGVDGTIRGGVAPGNEGAVGPTDVVPVTRVTGSRFTRFTPGS